MMNYLATYYGVILLTGLVSSNTEYSPYIFGSYGDFLQCMTLMATLVFDGEKYWGKS